MFSKSADVILDLCVMALNGACFVTGVLSHSCVSVEISVDE